ncbi:MAG: amidase [Nitrospirota bacterium]|nr:MAG: amidase [Nitrospirota bacterium]
MKKENIRVPTPAAAAGKRGSAPSDLELAYMPAEEALKRFKAKKLSPVEVLKEQISRIEALNNKVNCITYKHFDEAMKSAKASEARYVKGTPRALEGVTVAIKDENQVKGWKVTMGSLLLKDAAPSEEDSAIIDFLKRAGAVLHIQTTVPEFYLGPHAATRLWGVTGTPWNLQYTCGGSSGGSGAALAAGFATLATGSDMGGSIRIPAAQSGVFGFKPPFQRVATSEIGYESLGPMARNLTDLLLMQNVICGPHLKVHASLRPKLEYPLQYESVKGMKVVVDYARSIGPLDGEIEKSIDSTIAMLKGLGCLVTVKDLGFKYEGDFPLWAKGLLSTGMGMLIEFASQNKEALTPYVREFVDKYQGNLGPKQAAEADALLARYHGNVQKEVFGAGYHALVMPTMLTPYVPADWYMDDEKYFVINNGKKQSRTWAFVATWVWNMLGRYPVMTVPVGLTKKRVPLGVQVIGNTFDDLTSMRLSAALEAVAPRLFSGKMMPDFRRKA